MARGNIPPEELEQLQVSEKRIRKEQLVQAAASQTC
jgi:hypothetical protein